MTHLMMRPWPDDGANTSYEVSDGDLDRPDDPATAGPAGGALDPAPTRPAADAAVSRPVRCPECGALVVWTADGSAFCCACRWFLDPDTHAAILARRARPATSSEGKL